jgi:hypothetical protein
MTTIEKQVLQLIRKHGGSITSERIAELLELHPDIARDALRGLYDDGLIKANPACPFTYANGKKCTGHICRAKAFGPRSASGRVERHYVVKYRLWCSEKDDHAGIGHVGKERMEFYPRELPDEVLDGLWASGLIES